VVWKQQELINNKLERDNGIKILGKNDKLCFQKYLQKLIFLITASCNHQRAEFKIDYLDFGRRKLFSEI